MAGNKSRSLKQLGDAAVIERVQSILVNAAEGRRSVGDDGQYTALRKELIRRPFDAPPMVIIHPSVDSFAAYIKGIENRRERVERVRAEFKPLLDSFQPVNDSEGNASAWTGIQSRAERLKAVRNLLPLAQAAVEGLIATLSEPGANGGPLLDEREQALEQLRALHRTLGELLAAADAGHFDDALGQGLAAEAGRYAKRAAHALRDEPIPYLSSALLIGIFTACGLPGLGGFLSDIALTVRRNTGKQAG